MKRLISIVAVFFLAQWLPTMLHSQLLYTALAVPGTFLHEAAHYGFALLLQGNPGTFSILPSFSGGEMESMGHITFTPNWWNAATVCMAPLLVLPASIWLMLVGARLPILLNIVCVYTAACGFYSCIPSSADWNIAISEPLSFLVAIPILLGSLWILWKLIYIEIREIV